MLAIKRFEGEGLAALQVVEVAEPEAPKAGELLVRVRASSLNYLDYLTCSGQVPAKPGHIPLCDGAGEIVAVGEGTLGFQVGDKVVSTFYPNWQTGKPTEQNMAYVPGVSADGFARDYVCLPATAFTKVPDHYDFEQAATLGCAALTAWKGLVVDGDIQPGDVVVTQGTGGVSIFALQFALMSGATVIATSSSDAKLDKLKALGAQHVINYKETPDWGKAVKKITDGYGADHVIDVGGAATLGQSIKASAYGGHIAVIGILSGYKAEVSPTAIFSKLLRIQGVSVGSRQQQQNMVKALEGHPDFRPVIDKSFPLQSIKEAFDYQLSGQHFGKITLTL